MEQSKIDKLNELARKARTCGLNDEELALQKDLRAEYVKAFRDSLTGVLDNTYIQRPDGTREKIRKKDCG
jgi:uncharacterized protein YnzC (UPF0291/DUF896 family)